ncbi:MAG: serine/threonine protein kinase [Planctomycetaceae bacterium]|nr:serine/threonine protein kinase [Planctomycetaceae bacterium]
MSCPNLDELRQFLEGSLNGPLLDEVAAHLECCPDCQASADDLIGGLPSVCRETQLALGSSEISWSKDALQRLVDGVAKKTGSPETDFIERLPFPMGDYELLEVLGRGGMGVVYRARQVKLNRIVAIKMIGRSRIKPSLIGRFYLEAESAGKLDHPGIVPIFEVGEFGNQAFYTMPLISGGTLADRSRCSRFSERAASEMVRDVANAIQFAHERGIIHRDLKPSNILLEQDGRPKVADFGLAKQLESGTDLTASGEVLGTPSYMAPEQVESSANVTTSCDIYGLGGILYFLLSGRAPFEGNDPVGVMYQVVHSEPVPMRKINPQVSRDLETIVSKCLSKQPGDRYATAADVADELSRYLAGKPIEARPLGPMGRLGKWCKRHPATATVSLVAVLALVFGSTFSLYFGLLANNRATQLSQANGRLTVAESQARDSADRAEQEALAATEQANNTLGILEMMLYKIQNEVTDEPDEQASRRQLLDSVLSNLDQLTPQYIDAARLKRCRATALQGLAEVVMQMGDSTGYTGTSGSRTYYEQAIELFQQIFEEYPDDRVAKSDLAQALSESGNTLAEAGKWREAYDSFGRSLSLYEELVLAYPDDSGLAWRLAEIEVFYGEGLQHTGHFEAAAEFYHRSRDRCRDLLKQFPSDREIRNQYTYSLMKLGDWYLANKQSDESEACFREMHEVCQQLTTEFPFDASFQMDLSTSLERLAGIHSAHGRLEKALELHLKSAEIASELGRQAPENDLVQWQVSFGHHDVATFLCRLGRFEEAIAPAKECAGIRLRLAEQDPTNPQVHGKLFHAISTLTTALEAQQEFEEARHWHQEAIRFAKAYKAATDENRFQTAMERSEAGIARCNEKLAAAESVSDASTSTEDASPAN